MAKTSKRTWTAPDGTARTAWRVDFTDRQGNRGRRQFRTKAEAELFRRSVERKIDDRTYRPEAERVTVAEVATQWLTHCERRVGIDLERSTYDDYRRKVTLHILGRHGVAATRLSELRWSTIEEMAYRLRSAGMSGALTAKVVVVMRMMCGWCVDQDLMATNPTAGRKLKLTRRDRPELPLPTHDDVAAVLVAADDMDPEFGLICRIAAICGLRAGEIRGLTWSNVDLDQRRIRVVQRIDAYGSSGAPKSRAGIREVPMSVGLVRRMREHWLRKGRPDEGLLFTNTGGGPIDHQNMLRRRFAPALKAAGVRFRFHDFRSYAISAWLQAGTSIKAAQERAGHSDHDVTLSIYAKVFDEDGRGDELGLIDERLERHPTRGA